MENIHVKKDGTLDKGHKSSRELTETHEEFLNEEKNTYLNYDLFYIDDDINEEEDSDVLFEEDIIDRNGPIEEGNNTFLSLNFDNEIIPKEEKSASLPSSSPPTILSSPVQSTSLYNSSDIRLNQDGTIDLSSKAVKEGSISFNYDRTVNRDCPAVCTGRLVLNSEGFPDLTVHTDLKIRKNPGELPTTVYRDKYQQIKFRRNFNCPKDYDASHIVDLELAKNILRSKPGRHPTEDELRISMKPINKLLELRLKTVNRANQENPDNDRAMAKRIMMLIKGEPVMRTRALDQKILQMKNALHSIPKEEMNPQIKYVMKEIDRIAIDDVE